ncbi:MAG: hypothetical protein JWO03_502 [Bacteroidetes bacterium]|nr:hypothetical protein [Bacteroidota bacterium]
MKRTPTRFSIVFLLCLGASFAAHAQTSSANLFYNKGDQVFVQSGAVLHVQGDYVNAAGSTTTNNGVINVEGDVTNSASFLAGGSGEQTLRLIGNAYLAGSAVAGEQSISGFSGSNALYNLVVDRASAQIVRLNSDLQVNGSLVWNSAAVQAGTAVAATYTPSSYPSTLGNSTMMQVRTAASTFITPTGNGLVKLYNSAGTTDYELYLNNGANNAVQGYRAITAFNFTGSRAATAADGYLETRANAGVAKGFARLANTAGTPSTSTYVFPVGGVTATYNPIKIYFKTMTGGTLKLTSKFTDDAVASLSTASFYNHFDKGNSTGQAAVMDSTHNPVDYTNNPGYNVFQTSTCGGAGNWFIMNKASLKGHGYWSFDAVPISTTPTFSYTAEAYPHGYVENTGVTTDPTKRLLRENADGFTSVPQAVNFENQLMQVVNPTTDLVTYSYFKTHANFTGCNDGADGIVGGIYTSFSHFGVGSNSSPTGNALPVTLVDLSATPIDNSYIRVDWITASEINNSGFNVMRSDDGINFTKIGWVDGHGSSNEVHTYSFDDHMVLQNVVYYYQLKQVDFDGRSEDSRVVSAEITDGPSLIISNLQPNPTSGTTRVVIGTTDALPASIQFYDILGKEIMSNNYQLVYGTNVMTLQTEALAAATYTVVIKVGTSIFTKKLVVVK